MAPAVATRRAGAAGPTRLIAANRRARFAYEILETVEAGLALEGSEVKSLRAGKASLAEAYATENRGELYLINAHIPEYTAANRQNHAPRRPRKLLLHKREMARLIGAVQKEGMTLVPLRLYFNARGIAKLELALGRGKKLHDKRETQKARDWARDKARVLRERG
jgi:SsrA-binding protein